ncbi:diguanylate cyclase [Desulfurobacterium pacificum]|uniref:diguanylate cyclase n=1 Tax=Desulfurobacterium pacificum TaxID=240166 RepID=A0ABY1N9U7_9BACT|nr:diguanylate cyclase [Desulfurobacterium pacificum]SMP03653.1 diguanylate cyclase [Desulfurobacterium pacificum]
MEKEREIKCKALEKLREKKRLTPSELQFISSVAKETLKFLARNNIPLVPENYVLWFEIFCYILENNLKLSDLEIMGLFKTKYPTTQSLENVLVELESEDKELIKKIVTGITEEIENLIYTLEEHQVSLKQKEDSVREVKDNIEDRNIKDMLSFIITELQTIRAQNNELKKKLEESNQQIKKLTKELEESRKEASTDFLTQVANRASFDRALSDMVKDFYNRNYPFALLMIDIDNFKQINDTYGHQAGDYVLQELARVIKQQLRARDIVARYGGEEFAIILPGVTFSQAVKIAERIRKSVEKHLFKYRDKVIPVTISVGVAVMRDGLDEVSIVEKADKALYLAKRAGKNQVKTDLDVELEE